jgi:O-antigen/teichoic acid export membrane protein
MRSTSLHNSDAGYDSRPTTLKPNSLWTVTKNTWQKHKDLLANSVSLLGTTLVTSAVGFAFWAFAARVFSQQAVGYGSATISATTLLGTIGVFGLGTVLIGELPRRRPRAGLVSAALMASGLGSLLLALGFIVVSPLVSERFDYITSEPLNAAAFAGGVILTAVALVFDQATIGLMRGGVQLTRNLVFAITKMVALPAAAVTVHSQFGLGISVSWVAGLIVSLAGSAIWLYAHRAPVLPKPDWAVLRGLGKVALAHNWLNLALIVPYSLIPVVVTVVVSPSANAAFYIAWTLASFLFAIPTALSTVLFAVASAEPHLVPKKLRFALKVSLWIGIPAMLTLCFGAHFALILFGPAYVRDASFPLMMLSLTYVPILPKTFYVAVCRATGRVSRAAVVLTTYAAIEIAAAGVGGALGGLNALALAIVAVTVVEGMVTSPAVLRAVSVQGRHRRITSGVLADQADSANIGKFDNPLVPEQSARLSQEISERQRGFEISAAPWLSPGVAPTVPFPVIACKNYDQT